MNDGGATPPLTALRVWDDPIPRSGALNMALDECLLRTAPTPVLRRYRWAAPTVSFGCFVPLDEVTAAFPEKKWQLVRRWTGGGIVPHDGDETYALVVPAGNPFACASTTETYAAVHGALARALRQVNVDATLASPAPSGIGGLCFELPVTADVMLGPRKVSGAAQRRCRAGLLHQGTLQGVPWPDAFPRCLAATIEEWQPDAAWLAQAEESAAERYATDAWLRRR